MCVCVQVDGCDWGEVSVDRPPALSVCVLPCESERLPSSPYIPLAPVDPPTHRTHKTHPPTPPRTRQQMFTYPTLPAPPPKHKPTDQDARPPDGPPGLPAVRADEQPHQLPRLLPHQPHHVQVRLCWCAWVCVGGMGQGFPRACVCPRFSLLDCWPPNDTRAHIIPIAITSRPINSSPPTPPISLPTHTRCMSRRSIESVRLIYWEALSKMPVIRWVFYLCGGM